MSWHVAAAASAILAMGIRLGLAPEPTRQPWLGATRIAVLLGLVAGGYEAAPLFGDEGSRSSYVTMIIALWLPLLVLSALRVLFSKDGND